MNPIIAGILVLPLFLPSPKQTQGTKLKCKDFIEVVPVPPSSVSQKLLIKRADTTPDHVYSCVGRRDLKGGSLEGITHKEKFKKNQVVKVPKSLFLAFSPWIAEYQYSFGKIDSTGPNRSTNFTGQTLFLRYSKTVKKKYDLIFWFGLNQLDAKGEASSTKYNNTSKPTPVGQLRFKFNYNANWSYYAFARFNRYSVSGIDGTGTGKQTFIQKIDNGLGLEKSWSDHWVSRIDGSLVYPSPNDTNSLKSGFEAAVELEYLWKDWMVNYRVNYLKLNSGSETDGGYFQALRVGYRF